jgi:hypothetical protein
LPTPTIEANENLLSTSATGSIQWYLNGTPIIGATSNTYQATENGNYSVGVSLDNGCESISINFPVTTVSLAEVESFQVRLYPNPAGDFLHIDWKGSNALQVTLRDAAGRLVITKTLNNSGTLDLSNIPSGIYFTELHSADKVKHVKLVHQQ